MKKKVEADEKPLEGMVIVISVYTANERLFIEALATILGAIKNDSYAKKQRPLLICPAAEGAKYNAALKWSFPVVTSKWLVECARTGTRVKMDPFLVGDAVVDPKKWDVCRETTKSSSDTSGENSERDGKKKNAECGRSTRSCSRAKEQTAEPDENNPSNVQKATRSLPNQNVEREKSKEKKTTF